MRGFHGPDDFVGTFARTWAPTQQPHVLANVAMKSVRYGTLGERPVLWNWTRFARALPRAFRITSNPKNRCDRIASTDTVCEIPSANFLCRPVSRRFVGHCSCKANRAIHSKEPCLTPHVGREGLFVPGVIEIVASRLERRPLCGASKIHRADPPVHGRERVVLMAVSDTALAGTNHGACRDVTRSVSEANASRRDDFRVLGSVRPRLRFGLLSGHE